MKKAMLSSLILSAILLSPDSSANYFKDNFSWGYDNNIWTARDGNNGTPFGCSFKPNMLNPSEHGLTLSSSQGACAELQSNRYYGYGKVQGSLKSGDVAGTVSSIFTYTSWWDSPGRAWQEIDIELLPSLGNVVHTNVIYQPQGGSYQSWEQDIDLSQYGLDYRENLLTIGFDWSNSAIRWYLYDANGQERTIRMVYKDNGDGVLAYNEIPAYAWPVDKTKIMINHWYGDNSQQANYFPGQYYGASSWVYYDFIEYIPY
ncbi:family 16 glycosylhydrolase [Pseudoalteromonas fenneropenaei]|uniref:Family 16 glycosylhydrolase n=1 Tax=Pseudoalteromonas fenneropenaei TaxID=1737459 RepID=A0ABV7CP55_9GAMM